MKLKNAPARKLARQAKAQKRTVTENELSAARRVRTKKDRSGKARIR